MNVIMKIIKSISALLFWSSLAATLTCLVFLALQFLFNFHYTGEGLTYVINSCTRAIASLIVSSCMLGIVFGCQYIIQTAKDKMAV